MRVSYKILFAVDINNEYYSDGRCLDFTVVPSASTAALLRDKQLLYKLTGNKLVILTKVHDTLSAGEEPGTLADQQLIPVDLHTKFVFYLQLQQPVFTTITNIHTSLLSKKRFYFSNIYETAANGQLHLSSGLKPFDSNAAYVPGDLVRASGKTFECIKSASNKPTSDTEFWFDRGTQTYASANDLFLFTTTRPRFKAKTAAASFHIQMFAFDPVSKQFTIPVLLNESVITTGDAATKEVTINAHGLPEGRYVVKINGEDYEGGTDVSSQPIPVYVSDEAVYKSAFGVIEIYHFNAGNTAFDLLDASDKVKDTGSGATSTWLNYVIQFPERMAHWKYINRKNKVNTIETNTPGLSFTKTTQGELDVFLSNIPIKLSQKPKLFDLLLTNAVSSQPPPVPNPNPNTTGILNQVGTDYHCTIYLNY